MEEPESNVGIKRSSFFNMGEIGASLNINGDDPVKRGKMTAEQCAWRDRKGWALAHKGGTGFSSRTGVAHGHEDLRVSRCGGVVLQHLKGVFWLLHYPRDRGSKMIRCDCGWNRRWGNFGERGEVSKSLTGTVGRWMDEAVDVWNLLVTDLES